MSSPRLEAARAQLHEQLLSTGAFVLKGPLLPRRLITNVLDLAAALPALPREERLKIQLGSVPAVRGIYECHTLNSEQSGRTIVTRNYDSFEYGYESSARPGSSQYVLGAPNLVPSEKYARDILSDYYTGTLEIGHHIAEAISLTLGLDGGYLRARANRPCSQLRLLRYRENSQEQGLGEHTDYECFTLLLCSAEGLEVRSRDNGRWGSVQAIAPSVIVLLGDLVEILSNGVYRAANHRVAVTDVGRTSAVFFYGLDYNVVVRPVVAADDSLYPPVLVGEHLTAMAIRNFPHLQEAVHLGRISLPFTVPDENPLKSIRRGI